MSLSKLTVRRLTKLADYMASLPKKAEKHFNMQSWFEHKGDHPLGLNEGEVPEKKHYFDCGTTACALGWAATIPSFKKAGLKVIYYENDYADVTFNGDYIFADNTHPFLDLEESQSEYLFGSDVSVKTPKEWAKRCRAFLRAFA